MCLLICFIQTANYYDLSTAKNTLYSVDLNLNNEAIWKQEHIWFQSEDQSIGNVVHPLLSTKTCNNCYKCKCYACNKHDDILLLRFLKTKCVYIS